MSATCIAWDISEARAKAAESGKPVSLTRPDGSSSGLCVMPDGQVRRATLKPQGKAARKEFKRLRRQIQSGTCSDSVARIYHRRMLGLCGVSAPSVLKPAGGAA